jgi:tight adherence protein B
MTYMLGAAVTFTLAISLVLPIYLAAGFALLLAIIIPVSLVRWKGKKRLDLLSRQLPDALDLMARGLTVGHPLNATVASVANDMKDPIATEFGIIVDQVSYGDDMVDAFASFAERTGLEDVRYLSVSVGIQHGTGGNLAQVLKTLASVIRDRISMRKRVKAISAEGRLTSQFLSALPLVILAATSFTAPNYYAGVAGDPLFRPLAIVILGLVVANYLILRRLVDFRI